MESNVLSDGKWEVVSGESAGKADGKDLSSEWEPRTQNL
jgi:hypothetical protein